jgi:hypothetical protein
MSICSILILSWECSSSLWLRLIPLWSCGRKDSFDQRENDKC